MTTLPPRHTKSTFTFKMIRVTHKFVTFQKAANQAHFIWRKNNYFPRKGYGGGNSMKIINFLLKSILNSLQMRKIMFDSSICSNIAWNWLSYVIEEHNSLNKVSNQCFAKNWLSYYFSCWFLIYNNFILSVYNL